MNDAPAVSSKLEDQLRVAAASIGETSIT